MKATNKINKLFSIIEAEYNLDKERLLSRCRWQNHCDLRKIMAVILRSYEYPRFITTQAGLVLHRDHSTIVHYSKSHKALYKQDYVYTEKFDNILKKFLA